MIAAAFPDFLKRLGRRPVLAASLGSLALALLLLPTLDLAVHRQDPWPELARLARGLAVPRVEEWRELGGALLTTIAFAFAAVPFAAVAGVALALAYRMWAVRWLCACVRAVHEVFWGLLFMQIFGLSALTGVLAIAVPYAAIFARVFADLFAQQSPLPGRAIGWAGRGASGWLYAVAAQAWPSAAAYLRYRFECALRASTILGFIGLPTLGFHLESAFKEGHYAEAGGLLWAFYLLLAGIRFWAARPWVPLWCLAAWWLLPESPPLQTSLLGQFFGHDLWPAPLREGDWSGALRWYGAELLQVALPAAGRTLAISLVALALAGVSVLGLYPLASRAVARRLAPAGHALLLFLRATPELILAFVLLLLLGPSALPAVVALAVHNAAIVAYLSAREADRLPLRPDAPRAANLWAYEMTPRLWPRAAALLAYRFEVILRESAILGILGVWTLGLYIDTAFAELRLPRALFLIAVTAALNVAVEACTRRLAVGRGAFAGG
ncbi:MAG: phosphonate ABC transporter, permease protein PhnE [Porticoccaceae bacterium]|nr:MAG: phosphonate ABC transporter, permease protein PhnE [Porticoccaceae bacterium]